MTKGKKFTDITNAKERGGYRKVIQDIIDSGVCPFCPKNFKWHQNPILKKSENWFITTSTWPYKDSKHHFLIICTDHKESFSDLTTKDFKIVQKLTNWVIDDHGLKGGALILRFGSTKYTGATVVHLHFHLIVPEVDKDGRTKPVWFPIG